MTLLLAHSGGGHWLVHAALFLGPVLVAIVVLGVWSMRDRHGRDEDGEHR